MDDQPTGTAILCAALNVEYIALREQLTTTTTHQRERGSLYEIAQHRGPSGNWKVVLTLTDRDNTPAAVQVERAITRFRPDVVLMVGVAGGRRDTRHGDVIAATEIYNYESGMDADDSYRPRIKSYRSSHLLVQHASLIAREKQWHNRITCTHRTPPAAFVKPLAAGTKVVAGNHSATAKLIENHCGDAQGIEMEGYGILAGVYPNPGVEALVIRGVSDLLGDKTKTNDQSRQPTAARHAAAFAFALLDRLPPGQSAPAAAQPVESNKFIGAQGPGATANIGVMGDNGRGVININRT